jgi:hypothetical protein
VVCRAEHCNAAQSSAEQRIGMPCNAVQSNDVRIVPRTKGNHMLLIILLIFIVLFFGGGFVGPEPYRPYGIGAGGLLVLILLILILFGSRWGVVVW